LDASAYLISPVVYTKFSTEYMLVRDSWKTKVP